MTSTKGERTPDQAAEKRAVDICREKMSQDLRSSGCSKWERVRSTSCWWLDYSVNQIINSNSDLKRKCCQELKRLEKWSQIDRPIHPSAHPSIHPTIQQPISHSFLYLIICPSYMTWTQISLGLNAGNSKNLARNWDTFPAFKEFIVYCRIFPPHHYWHYKMDDS